MKFVLNQKRVGLFFEMGTGKTKVGADLLHGLHHMGFLRRALVVAPSSVLGVWEDEFEKNRPPSSSLKLLTVQKKLKKKRAWLKGFEGVVLTNYESTWRIKKQLVNWAPQIVVADECHKIKAGRAKQSRAMWRIGRDAEYVLALTGTPIANSPMDLWSQFQFIVPGLMDNTFSEFKKRYGIWGGYGGFELIKYKNLKHLSKLIRPHIRTMKKADHLQLPEKVFSTIPVQLPIKVRKEYERMKKELIAYVEKGKAIAAPIVLTKMMKLSQISGGFIRDEDGKDHWLHDSKLDAIDELSQEAFEAGEKRLVVFARFRFEIASIVKRLEKRWKILQIHGGVSNLQRKKNTSLFQSTSPDALAIVCQIASGSLGINLQSSHIAVFYSIDYSFSNYEQAVDRIHRIGQERRCLYYHIVSRATLDRDVLRAVAEKKNLLEEVIHRRKVP